ncbi:MAG: metal ABC transporter permease [Candidatus Schekmanbacteria bacterium]|nr:metal ABC transporter permease [Candidatus Schekmanbacteria bacterium]
MTEWLRSATTSLASSGWLPETFAYAFMVRAMIACLILAPLLGVLSPLVVTRGLAFFSSAIGHSALTGLALAILLGESLDGAGAGVLCFCLLVSVAMTYVRHRSDLPSDTVIGVFVAFTLGLGICLLVAVTQRFNIHQVEALLFGSVVTVTESDLLFLLGVAVMTVLVIGPMFNGLFLSSVDPELAAARRINVARNDYFFLMMLTAVIVASAKVIGALMVEALVIVPAAIARNVAGSLRAYCVWSCVFACVGTQGGLLLGSFVPVPTGAAIVLVLAGLFGVTFVVSMATAAAARARGRAREAAGRK